ncbi:MAG: MBL fold metallo-hydrolase [Ruminococcaceae bacterium]|nr:MBL fold metallo-hydrolase [Oscillospiraceae bacterium]
MIKIATLFSGSSGNCTLIKTECTAILIDAGRNCKAICTGLCSLGLSIEDIDAIFVTHEHKDHISALDVLMRKRPIPIHSTMPSSRELCKKADVAKCTCIHDSLEYTVKVGDLTVTSFPLPHDSAAHVGYIAESDDGDRAGVATDMGFITALAVEKLCHCRQAVIEANHDRGMLMYGPYPQFLKERILSKLGHLSNKDSAILCCEMAKSGTEKIILAHLSFENNTPDRALSAVNQLLEAEGYTEHITVKVAGREVATVI